MSIKVHPDITAAVLKANLHEIITDEVLTTLQVKMYKKNETVVVSGNELKYFYIVIEGRVAIHNYSDQGNIAVVDYVEKTECWGTWNFFNSAIIFILLSLLYRQPFY